MATERAAGEASREPILDGITESRPDGLTGSTPHEKPREWTLRARWVPGCEGLIPYWVVLATRKPAVPDEDVRVLEAEPVERELAEVKQERDRLRRGLGECKAYGRELAEKGEGLGQAIVLACRAHLKEGAQ